MGDIADYQFVALGPNGCEQVHVALPVVAGAAVAVNPVTGQKTYTLPQDASSSTLATVIAAPAGLSGGQWIKPESRPATEAEFHTVGAERVEVPIVAMGALWGNRAVEPTAAHRGVMNPDGTIGYYSRPVALADLDDNNGASVTLNLAHAPFTLPDGRYPGQVVNVAFGGGAFEGRINGNFRGVFRNGQHKVFPHTTITSAIARINEAWLLVWNGMTWLRFGGIDRWLSQFTNLRENHDGTVTILVTGQGSTTNLNPGQHVVFDITVPISMMNPTTVVPIITDYHATNTPALGIGTVPTTTSPMALMAFPLSNTATTVRIGGWHMGAALSPVSQVGVINVLLDRVVPDYAALGGIASF